MSTDYINDVLAMNGVYPTPEDSHTPKDITHDIEFNREAASFDYSIGIRYAQATGLKQTTSFSDVFAGTHYIVCCGDVMVDAKDKWSNIQRRII